MIELRYALADPDFYAPLGGTVSRGATLRPGGSPDGWSVTDVDVWTMWCPEGASLAGRGWKVHVSARPDRLRPVLDIVAAACFQAGVAFKHLSAELFYTCMHHKYGPRTQGGKFCTAYPPTEDASRALLERLSADLADEEGPFILTDRRFRDSRTVHYRYGAYTPMLRVLLDGTRQALVTDGNGRAVEDRREAGFVLPPGITDPFETPEADDDGDPFDGLVFEAALGHNNAGGVYRGRDAAGRQVFVKEARGHTGLTWDGLTAPERLRAEHATLAAIHAAAPGLCPEPLGYLRAWEHEFLVTEFVAGTTLKRWMVANNRFTQLEATAADWADYHARCERVMTAVEALIERLHAIGYVFNDISPENILIDTDDSVRFIDFEAARPIGASFIPMGTHGYAPPPGTLEPGTAAYDGYGLAALAQLLLSPLHQVVQRNPDALAHLRYDLAERAPVPEALWRRATRFHAPGETPELPTPQRVEDEPVRHLTDLRDGVAAALLATADAAHPDRVFPTVPQGYETNTTGVAFGTAGVLHALHRARVTVPEEIVERFRTDALRIRDTLPPGLHVGAAGIAWTLAEYGLLTEADELLSTADRHPLLGRCATYGLGSAGVAMTHLALYGHTGLDRHLDRAHELADALPADAELTPLLGADDATGLLHGRCGIALLLQQLASVTGEKELLDRGVRLLHAELDRASDPAAPALAFPVSARDRRSMPYLYCGTAGMLRVVGRYRYAGVSDERLAEALPRLLPRVRTTYTVLPGLYQGLAGLGLTLSEYARLTGDATLREAAWRSGRALFKYALPHPTGVRFLGDLQMRYSTELWSGSAGVLLFLAELLDPRPDPLFTVDALARDGLRLPADVAGLATTPSQGGTP